MTELTVKEMRTKIGMSQRAFADRFGIPVRTLQDWEQGRYKPPEYVIAMIRTILEYEQKE